MSTAPQPLFDMSKATPLFDMSKSQAIGDEQAKPSLAPGETPGASQITGISADTRGPFRKLWEDQIRPGLTAAQPGQGLKQQPTVLGSAAQFAGMAGTVASQLMGPTEAAAGAGKLAEAIPSTERAGQAFKELQGAIGTHHVAMTDRLANSLADIKDAVDTGSTMPQVVNKFVSRIAEEGSGPLSYKEARQFYHNVSELSASEKMASKGNDLRLLNEFKHALGETIGDTADSADLLQKYQGAMKEFSQAKGLQEFVGKALKYGATAAFGGGAAYKGYRMLSDLAGK